MKPKYYQLKDQINEKILNGTYPLFTKLPTEVELSETFGVSRATVRSALELLVEDGIIEKKWGSGNIVISKASNSKQNTIALVISNKRSEFAKTLIAEIQSVIFKEKLELEIFDTGGRMDSERDILKYLSKESYYGLIIEPLNSALPTINIDLFHKLFKHQLPIIFIRSLPLGLQTANLVRYKDYELGYQLCRDLINKGGTLLGGIFIRDSQPSIERYSGYTDALRDANLSVKEELFLWCNSADCINHISRSSATVSKFLRYAQSSAAVIYNDDLTLNTDGFDFIVGNTYTASKSIGKEAVSRLITIKKGGRISDTAISFKAI